LLSLLLANSPRSGIFAEERLPDAEEDVRVAIPDDVTKPSPVAGTGLLHVRTQNIENNPMHSRDGLEFAALFAAA
jgi:hypothetical protein